MNQENMLSLRTNAIKKWQSKPSLPRFMFILTHRWLPIYTVSNFVNFESFSTDSDELQKFLAGWIASADITM